MKKSKSTDATLKELIEELNAKSREVGSHIWRDIAIRLTTGRACINVSKISRYTKKNDLVAVPGKILGAGVMKHPVTAAAFSFSKQARDKILGAGGNCISFRELMKKNQKGSRVVILE
ncbi:MAG: 50S ribosomal protein L18e [Candidatus Hydrothermarchaeaceae archaeon]